LEWVALVRDIVIILAGLFAAALLGILALLAFMGYRWFVQFKAAMPDLIDTSKSTLNTVKGTTDFVTDTAVVPLIRLVAVLTALSRFVAVLFGGQRRRGV
jgi:hypothetical protein